MLQPNRFGRTGRSASLERLRAGLPKKSADSILAGLKDADFTVYAKHGESPRDLRGWERLRRADPVLFYHGRRYFARGRVAHKFVSKALSRSLWPDEEGVRDHIILIAQVQPIDLPAEKFHRAIGYASHHVIQGFTVLDEERTARAQAALKSVQPTRGGTIRRSDLIELDETTAIEGRQVLREHLSRERVRSLVRRKRERVLRESHRLACEACGFDFRATYRWLDLDWCEVHHNRPLGEGPSSGREIGLKELSILCANCHRMIHRESPMPSVTEFRKRLRLEGGRQRR